MMPGARKNKLEHFMIYDCPNWCLPNRKNPHPLPACSGGVLGDGEDVPDSRK